MNIGFHYHFPFKLTNNGKIFTVAYLGVFIDELAKEFTTITLYSYAPMREEEHMLQYEIKSTNIIYVPLGPHNSVPQRIVRILWNWGRIRSSIIANDVIIVRAPTPLLPFFYLNCYFKPFVQYLVGSYQAGNKTLHQTGLRSLFIKIFNTSIEKTQQLIALRKITIANSEKIATEYKKYSKFVYLVKTTTLSKDDIFHVKEKKTSLPIKLLYTGRLTPSKGIEEILQACILLQKNDIPNELHIAGIIEKGQEGYIIEIKKNAQLHQYNNLIYHGFKNAGNELNILYRKCDIFITMPKNDTEGFPRVIWEAMANSCPVITSMAGSIPFFIDPDKHAILLQKVDAQLIADSIIHIWKNPGATQRMIDCAFHLAAENTMEKRVKEISSIINDHFDKNEH